MKAKFNHLLTTGLVIGVLSLNSCKKEEISTANSSDTKVQNFLKSSKKQQQLNATVFEIGTSWIPQLILKNSSHMKTDGNIEDGMECATVTIDSSSSPRIATVVFDGGCTTSGNHTFSGSVVIQYTNPTMGPGHISATFNSFTYDGMVIDGTMDYNNYGRNVADNIEGDFAFNLTSDFARDKIILNGSTNMTFEWTESRNTAYMVVTGTATDNNGIVFNQSTNAPLGLKLETGCNNHFVSGKLLLQSSGLDDEEIDYGTGDCDNLAISRVNGIDTPITLD